MAWSSHIRPGEDGYSPNWLSKRGNIREENVDWRFQSNRNPRTDHAGRQSALGVRVLFLFTLWNRYVELVVFTYRLNVLKNWVLNLSNLFVQYIKLRNDNRQDKYSRYQNTAVAASIKNIQLEYMYIYLFIVYIKKVWKITQEVL